jgi:hypothetical protein
VQEDALVEVPAVGVVGRGRRAFGEFVGPRGELATYAFGWTTSSHPHVARLSIGIGAGNPGGGTFHAVAFLPGGSYAFSLSDEPFEHVPQGVPHLSAERARGHVDLPFVRWAADQLMAVDRRAWWMRHSLLDTTCIQTVEVFEGHEPVLWASHDAHDGIRQLIGASDADAGTGKIGHLHHAVDSDPSLIDVLDLPPSSNADRTGVGDPWLRRTGRSTPTARGTFRGRGPAAVGASSSMPFRSCRVRTSKTNGASRHVIYRISRRTDELLLVSFVQMDSARPGRVHQDRTPPMLIRRPTPQRQTQPA